ncbi:MAG: glycosyltransferase family 4 protein [Kiritimatiellae bacterium]|nr:glycosyltransferase family 4 protein [Kiritimatiellia bacterium]
MHIIFYIEAFFPDPKGAAYAAHRLARSLRKRGVDISFIICDWGHEWEHGNKYDGFPVIAVTAGRKGKLSRIRGLIKAMRYLAQRRSAFDILHIHGGYYISLFLGWFTQILFRKPAILKITSNNWDTPDGIYRAKYGKLAILFYQNLAGVVAMTLGQTRKCRDGGIKGQIATIPNGVDCSVYRPVNHEEKQKLRKQMYITADIPVLVYAGWLGYGKGLDILLKIWEQTMQSFGKVALLCVGNFGEEIDTPEKLRHFMEAHDIPSALAEHPDFYHIKRVQNIEQYLQLSDIFVFPSRQEGFGTVQIEAMACGLPCVVNDIPDVSLDIFPDESVGYRVSDNQVQDYVRICSHLLADTSRCEAIGEKARERAVSCFSSDTIADRYIDFYGKILQAST